MDQKTKHTPGPWHAHNLHKGRTLKHWVVDTGTGTVTLDDAAHWEAGNAHLIAAAPAMYEALKGCLRVTEAWKSQAEMDGDTVEIEAAVMEIKRIKAALAQAEGTVK